MSANFEPLGQGPGRQVADRALKHARDREDAQDRPRSDQRQRGQHGDRHGGTSSLENELPKLYRVYKGVVARVVEYGAFVQIEGFKKQGLLHASQMSNQRIDDAREVLNDGDPLFVKVTNIDTDDGSGNVKIGLSIKTVSQRDGKDNDPTNIVVAQDQMRKRTHEIFESKKVELGAIFNTVCSKCGVRGHLAKDCFSSGGKTYDLVTEDDIEPPLLGALPEPEEEEGHSKHRKKHKKKHKKHHKHGHASDNDDDRDHANERTSSYHRHRKSKKKHKERDDSEERGRDRRHHSPSSSSKERRRSRSPAREDRRRTRYSRDRASPPRHSSRSRSRTPSRRHADRRDSHPRRSPSPRRPTRDDRR